MARRVLILALLMALATGCALATTGQEIETAAASEDNERSSLRGVSRLLGQYDARAPATCDKFPRVCRGKGSAGPDCCKKQCVNVMTDNLNCGACGRKCRYDEACCGGSCVNVMFDRRNCGGCKNRCNKDSFCKYGMCNYA